MKYLNAFVETVLYILLVIVVCGIFIALPVYFLGPWWLAAALVVSFVFIVYMKANDWEGS